MADEQVTITPSDDGPNMVRGPVKIVDADGNEWDISGRQVVALCRCGQSENKPFCDGTHSKVGFSSKPRAEA